MVTTAQIIGWIFTSSVVASLLTNAPKWWSDWRSGRNVKQTHALYAAIILEEFGVRCTLLIWDMDQGNETQGQYGRIHKELPKLANIWTEIDLKSLSLDARSRIMTLNAKLSLDNMSILMEQNQTDVWITDNYAIERGRDAFQIADVIRKSLRIKREPDAQMDRAIETLNKRHEKLLEQRRKTHEWFKKAKNK